LFIPSLKGDSEKPISSKTSYLLLQLLQKHPSMKAILVREISSLILRPQSQSSNSNGHAKYYGVITFNQIMLKDGEEDRKVAAQLVDIYFLLFRDILKDGGGKEEDEAVRTDPKEEDGRDGKKKHKKQWKGKDKKNSKDKKNAKGKGKEKASIPEGGFAETEDSDSKMISAILTGVNRAFPFAKMDDDVFVVLSFLLSRKQN
jgi:ribosome biogenesis protein MAK21